MSAFLSITDAVRDALLSPPALAGGRVRRGRTLSVADDEDSAIAINVARSRGELVGLDRNALQWETVVTVNLYARAAVGQDAEAALDPLLVSTWGRLLSMPLPAGANGVTLDPAVQWDVDEADATVGSAQLSIRINHITTTAELAAT